jgi:hypothetical protein
MHIKYNDTLSSAESDGKIVPAVPSVSHENKNKGALMLPRINGAKVKLDNMKIHDE